jgi:hypothetical protein
MAADTNTMLDTLAGVVQAIAQDRKLRQWFSSLAKKSIVERRNEIYAMTLRMTQQGEDARIITSLHLLADAKIFDAACQSLRELGQFGE